eukprot:jgi/Galph1/5359/GphlegSOOS_G3926.1
MDKVDDSEYINNAKVLFQYATGHWVSSICRVVASLKLCDIVKKLVAEYSRPATVQEIVQVTKTDVDMTYRLLRAAATINLFNEHTNPYHSFVVSGLGNLLTEIHPYSFRGMILLEAGKEHCTGWMYLEEAVTSGKKIVDKVFGIDDYFEAIALPDSKFSHLLPVFQGCMRSISYLQARCIVSGFEFGKYNKVCDIGAGPGILLMEILARNPHLRGTIADLPRVIEETIVIEEGVKDRCKTTACNFFEAVPQGHDLYIMKHVLHDWDDEKSAEILTVVSRCSPPKAELLLFEHVLPSTPQPSPGTLLDLHMGILLGSKERTEQERIRVLSRGGWKYLSYYPTNGNIQIVHAQKEA